MDMHPRILTWFWNLKVNGVIHAGAHKGEEAVVYSQLGFGPVTWIEAIPKLAFNLSELVTHPSNVINATIWSSPNEQKKFNVTSSSGSSSLFDLLEHKVQYPEILVQEEIEVTTTTLDQLNLSSDKNLLVLDLQGAEYEALLGSVDTLNHIDYIVAEVNKKQLYKGIKMVGDLDKLLRQSSFLRVAVRWTKHGWGEALYLKVSAGQNSLTRKLELAVKIPVFWCWLHFVEIPLVHIRSQITQLGASPSKAQ
jgi:FkbM family methyltransferase